MDQAHNRFHHRKKGRAIGLIAAVVIGVPAVLILGHLLFQLLEVLDHANRGASIKAVRRVLHAAEQLQPEPGSSTCPREAVSKDWIDFGRLQILSPDELELMATRLQLSREDFKDGWGHGIQLAIPMAETVAGTTCLAVRSPGKDNRFSGPRYSVAAFHRDDLNQDLVAVDGYFARWPK